MLMMVPRRWRVIAGTTARQHTMAARRFTASMASQSFGFPPLTGPNAADIGVADAARRIVDHAPERDFVGAIQCQLQVREDVLDLLALEELLSADDAVRD